jgi:hypothetical protein
MKIDLSHEQVPALTKELDGIVDRDRFPFLLRIHALHDRDHRQLLVTEVIGDRA